jgi:hypothetical protein
MLYITFIGGLAANVGLVLVLGLGLVLVHQLSRHHIGFETLARALVAWINSGGVALLTVVLAKNKRGRAVLLTELGVFAVVLLTYAVLGLAVIGYAAGLK